MEQWVQRVIDNGGAEPDPTTQDAVDVFARGLESNNLLSKMKAVNCMVPDSLIACCTPLIANYGYTLWTNIGFVGADLTNEGLQGRTNPPPRRLETGLNPSLAFSSPNSGGMTLYTDTAPPIVNDTNHELAIWETGQNFQLLSSYGTVVGNWYWYFDCWNDTPTNGRATINAPAYWNGYTSGNRTAANKSVIYRANSTTAHSEVASATGTPIGTPPNHLLPVFCVNDQTGGAPAGYSYYSQKRISFVAIHEGLTLAESATFFNLVQALRVALGGGWV